MDILLFREVLLSAAIDDVVKDCEPKLAQVGYDVSASIRHDM